MLVLLLIGLVGVVELVVMTHFENKSPAGALLCTDYRPPVDG